MLTPTDFIFNDIPDSQKPNFIECVNSPYSSNSVFSNSNNEDTPYQCIVKYKKNLSEQTKSAQYDYVRYLEFLNSYISSLDFTSEKDVYFPGVRYLSHGLVVFERPPSYKIIDVSLAGKDSIDEDTPESQYYLPIPWQVYIAMYNPKDMRLVSVKMYFTKTSLFDKNQVVYAPPMFNFFGSGTLCRPFFESLDDIEKYPKTISGIMASAYDWVWNSGFNFDITENLAEMIHTKKYQQFEQYIESDASKVAYKFLKDNPLDQIGSSLHKRYSSALLSCWEQVPLEHVSSINWTNYSISDFMFQEFDYTELRDQHFEQYIQENNITINESYDNPFHCEDGCDCDCSDSDCGCCEGCDCEGEQSSLSRDSIYSSYAFKRYIIDLSRNTEKTLDFAISKSIRYLKDSRVAQVPALASSVNYNFDNLIDSHFST
jgi:hypothetical protein